MILFEPSSDYPIATSDIPSGWALVTVGQVVLDIRQGVGAGNHNKKGLGLPHLRPMNVDRAGRISLDEVKYVDMRGLPLMQRGDVLFNNTNSAELVGKTAAFDLEGDWSFSNHMTRLRPASGVSPHFLAYQFLMLFREGYFHLRRTQHVGQASINGRTLADTVPFLLAPEAEQVAIVEELDRHFERLRLVEDAIDRARDRLMEYERLVVMAAASGTLVGTQAEEAASSGGAYESGVELLARLLGERDKGREGGGNLLDAMEPEARPDEEPAERSTLPEGWIWARVDQVGSVLGGRQRSPQHHHGEHMRPYLRVANVFEDRIDTTSVLSMNFTPAEYKTYRLEHGDILLNEGQSPELVGRPAMFRGEIEGACFQNTLLRFRAYPGVSPGFALLVFRSYLHTGKFRSIARWTTNIAHLGATRFATLDFPLPPLAEQMRILAEAERRLDLAHALSDIMATIRCRVAAARDAVLRQAFTGRLVEPNVDEEVRALLERIERERASYQEDRGGKRERAVARRTRGGKARAPLVEVLHGADGELTPEELLAGSGIDEDLIDEFFAELREAHRSGYIVQERDRQGRTVLRVPENVT